MPLNAVMKISGAPGEAKRPKTQFDKWIEIQAWDWEVEAETSWVKGGGASVGKPNPGKLNWEHYFDISSPVILKYIFSGQSFDTIELHMLKGTGDASGQQSFFRMIMNGAFITKVANSATDDGNVLQKVEMVFKDVRFEYQPQSDADGKLGKMVNVTWDIPGGIVS